jgi:hypothetical protein
VVPTRNVELLAVAQLRQGDRLSTIGRLAAVLRKRGNR